MEQEAWSNQLPLALADRRELARLQGLPDCWDTGKQGLNCRKVTMVERK